MVLQPAAIAFYILSNHPLARPLLCRCRAQILSHMSHTRTPRAVVPRALLAVAALPVAPQRIHLVRAARSAAARGAFVTFAVALRALLAAATRHCTCHLPRGGRAACAFSFSPLFLCVCRVCPLCASAMPTLRLGVRSAQRLCPLFSQRLPLAPMLRRAARVPRALGLFPFAQSHHRTHPSRRK